MVGKTIHVYRSDGGWSVKKEGRSARTFPTQREAVDAARRSVKSETAGQFVVYGKDGQIREHETYKMTPVQDPPKKSRRAGQISRAVGKVTLDRVQSEPVPPSDHQAEK